MPIIHIFIFPAHLALYLENRTVFIGSIYMLSAVINVGLNFLLVPIYSYYGAGISTIISLLFVFIVFYIVSHKSMNLSWNFIKLGRIIFSGLFSGAIGYYIYRQMADFSVNFIRLVILGFIILIIYIACLLILKVFDTREFKTLKELIRTKSEKNTLR